MTLPTSRVADPRLELYSCRWAPSKCSIRRATRNCSDIPVANGHALTTLAAEHVDHLRRRIGPRRPRRGIACRGASIRSREVSLPHGVGNCRDRAAFRLSTVAASPVPKRLRPCCLAIEIRPTSSLGRSPTNRGCPTTVSGYCVGPHGHPSEIEAVLVDISLLGNAVVCTEYHRDNNAHPGDDPSKSQYRRSEKIRQASTALPTGDGSRRSDRRKLRGGRWIQDRQIQADQDEDRKDRVAVLRVIPKGAETRSTV